MSGDSYHRCRHCRGFYETSHTACKWCNYQSPFAGLDGKPRIFPDRETCRAIQLAEFEQLPPEAHADCMGPPKTELTLLCNCLHCGPEGHEFEAIEMRWIVNERMWACPCTTCGGRGFGIDIHSAENRWQCAQCGHFYTPKNNDYHPQNAHCPKCGCKQANGWFDDDYDESDFEDFENISTDDNVEDDDSLSQDDSLPWHDDDEDEEYPDVISSDHDLGISWKEDQEEDEEENPFGDSLGRERILDDIDHPHLRDDSDKDFNEDDIPF